MATCEAHIVSHVAAHGQPDAIQREVAYTVRRTKMVVAGSAMAAMLTLGAGPAMADEGDFEFSDHGNTVEEFEFEDGALEIEFSDGSEFDLDLEGIEGDFLDFSDGDNDFEFSDSDVDTDRYIESDIDTAAW